MSAFPPSPTTRRSASRPIPPSRTPWPSGTWQRTAASTGASGRSPTRSRSHAANTSRSSRRTTMATLTDKFYLHSSEDSNYEQGKQLGLVDQALEMFRGVGYEVEFDI